MPNLDVSGAYCDLETVKAALSIQVATHDSLILEHLLAASREIEQLTLRQFFPSIATRSYRWPPFTVSATWELWTEYDLLSVSLLQAAAAGQNAAPVTLTHYFLEPQQFGPPYNRVEIDLSSSDVFQSGNTPQRSIAVTGQWGYCNTTVAAGALNGDINASVTSLIVSDATKVGMGDVLLIDSEAIYVDAPRVPSSATLAVVRGVNGTTPASHSNGAAITKYQAPMSVRRAVRADAIGTFQQDQSGWGRAIGSGETATEFQGKQVRSLRDSVVSQYRRSRTAAV